MRALPPAEPLLPPRLPADVPPVRSRILARGPGDNRAAAEPEADKLWGEASGTATDSGPLRLRARDDITPAAGGPEPPPPPLSPAAPEPRALTTAAAPAGVVIRPPAPAVPPGTPPPAAFTALLAVQDTPAAAPAAKLPLLPPIPPPVPPELLSAAPAAGVPLPRMLVVVDVGAMLPVTPENVDVGTPTAPDPPRPGLRGTEVTDEPAPAVPMDGVPAPQPPLTPMPIEKPEPDLRARATALGDSGLPDPPAMDPPEVATTTVPPEAGVAAVTLFSGGDGIRDAEGAVACPVSRAPKAI